MGLNNPGFMWMKTLH